MTETMINPAANRLPCPAVLAVRALAGALVLAGPVVAQTAPPAAAPAPAATPLVMPSGPPFTARLLVNDTAVTNWEVAQRTALLRALRTPGNLEEQAIEMLVGDRLRIQRATADGITLTPEAIEQGMAEFAARTNREVDEFLASLSEQGVAAATFRDFVRAGLLWREVVRARFVARAQVSEAEIDRAVALASTRGAVRVLLSEIVLPATPEYIDEVRPIAQQIAQMTTIAQFSAAARQVSIAPTREDGGQIDWIDLASLPEMFSSQILTLSPGQVTEPIPVPDALLLFQLRALEERESPEAAQVAVEYAEAQLGPGDGALRARLEAEADTCDDLYGLMRGLPEERLRLITLATDAVPVADAVALATLDANEFATLAVPGGGARFVMLCGRTLAVEESPSRADIRAQLANQRLNAFADGFLEELRADAFIREP